MTKVLHTYLENTGYTLEKYTRITDTLALAIVSASETLLIYLLVSTDSFVEVVGDFKHDVIAALEEGL